MAEVHALDDYYLAITFLITVAYQLFFFAIAFSLKFDKLTGKYSWHVVSLLLLNSSTRFCGRNQFRSARDHNVRLPFFLRMVKLTKLTMSIV